MPVVDRNGKPSWMPGHIKEGVYVAPAMAGTIDDAGEYIPPEVEEPNAKNNMAGHNARVEVKDDAGQPVKEKAAAPAWNPAPAFRIAALCLAALSSIVSAWFNFGYRASILPVPIAAVLSLIVVLSATLAPELVILCWRKRRFILAFMVSGVGMIASAYSMTTTIAGQYNSRTAQAVESMEVERNDDERKRIMDEIRRTNISIDTYQARITRATNAGTTDASATSLKKQDEARKKELEGLLAVSSGSIPGARRTARVDFYAWLGGLLGYSGGEVEFALSILPALLLDLAAPVFAVIFLVL